MQKIMSETILAAAIEEINESGLKFTMAALARRLSTSKRTLYENYPSKTALISEVVNRTIQELEIQDSRILEDSGRSCTEKIMELLTYPYASRLHLSNTLFVGLRTGSPDEWKKFLDFRGRKLTRIDKLCRTGFEQGYFRRVNENVLRLILSSYINALFEPENLYTADMSWKQAIAAMGDIIFHGLIKK